MISVQVFEGDGVAPQKYVDIDILTFTDHDLAVVYDGKLAKRNSSGDQRVVVKGHISQEQFSQVYAEDRNVLETMIEVRHRTGVIVVPSGNVKILSVAFGAVGEGTYIEVRADRVATVNLEEV